MSIEARLGRIERQLRPGREVEILPPVIVGHCGRQPTPEEERQLGPLDGWITYGQQLEAQEQANAQYLREHPGSLGNVIMIDVDVDREYEARRADDRIGQNRTS